MYKLSAKLSVVIYAYKCTPMMCMKSANHDTTYTGGCFLCLCQKSEQESTSNSTTQVELQHKFMTMIRPLSVLKSDMKSREFGPLGGKSDITG